jgi:hypothetical protein
MSYSRFSTSTWYTFHTSLSPDCKYKLPTQNLKNSQLFEICDFPSYHISYEDITKLGIDTVINQVKDFYSQEHKGQIFKERDPETNTFIYEDTTYPPKNPTEQELEELKTYILRFKEDVDNDFKLLNFIMLNWYYPVRNKVKFQYLPTIKRIFTPYN